MIISFIKNAVKTTISKAISSANLAEDIWPLVWALQLIRT